MPSASAHFAASARPAQPKELVQDSTPPSPVKPRKRPVVNQAEKRWREERVRISLHLLDQHSHTRRRTTGASLLDSTRGTLWGIEMQRNAHSRKASMVSDLVAEAQALSLKPKELVQDPARRFWIPPGELFGELRFEREIWKRRRAWARLEVESRSDAPVVLRLVWLCWSSRCSEMRTRGRHPWSRIW
jgi:hypothetical protein